jgi:hypothetical protein
MPDVVTSKTIFNGTKRLTMQFTNVSDGTGEAAVVKVDKSTFTGPDGTEPSSIAIDKIEGTCTGMAVTITANHTSPITIAVCEGGHFCYDYRAQGGVQTSGAGSTGDIEFTTTGATSGDSYNIIMWMRKKD